MGLRFPVAAKVDEDDCCWAIDMGKWVVVGGLGVGVVGSAAIVLIGVCRIMESKGSTMVDSEDGVLGVSSVGLEND